MSCFACPSRDREGTLRKTATCHACDHTESEDKPLRPGSSSAAAAGFSGGGGGGSGGGGAGGGYWPYGFKNSIIYFQGYL